MSHRHTAWTAGALAAVAMLLWATTAAAGPPVSLRGIGVPTVLSIYDHARRIGPDADPGDDDTEKIKELPDLEHVDTVVLDPGHGADNSGAIGITGVAEKYLTLELAYELRDRLQRRHPELRVLLTRYSDQNRSLGERIHLANRVDADLFLSLHYNAATHQRAIGVETYFVADRKATPRRHRPEAHFGSPGYRDRHESTSEIDEPCWVADRGNTTESARRRGRLAGTHLASGELAEETLDQLTDHIDTVDRGVKQANFGVLRGAHMPAAVIEAGFMSHPEEGRRLLTEEHRDKVVRALADAVYVFGRDLSKRTD